MISRLKIGRTKFTFVFRHKWDNQDETGYNSEFQKYEIGLWFKINRILGYKPKPRKDYTVNNYMIGINLIICKMWVSLNRGGKIL